MFHSAVPVLSKPRRIITFELEYPAGISYYIRSAYLIVFTPLTRLHVGAAGWSTGLMPVTEIKPFLEMHLIQYTSSI